jgi:hypothetical protein
MKLVEVIQ